MFDATKDLHVHLYGCLTPTQLWELGRDRYKIYEPRLEFYADEFEKVFDSRPDYKSYWQAVDGLESLTRDYLCTDKMSFARFQAKFYLPIGLFPLAPGDVTVWDTVCSLHRQEGLSYSEYRLVLPWKFSAADFETFMKAYHQAALRHSDSEFTARLVWSLPRQDAELAQAYKLLRDWLAANPDLAPACTGIDFCMAEENDSPLQKAVFFARVQADNETQHPLQILLHVGETFAETGLDVAAAKVLQAAELGVDRLGHAVALGIDPVIRRGEEIREPKATRLEYWRWLLEKPDLMNEAGIDSDEVRKNLAELFRSYGSVYKITYDDEFIQATRALQDCLMARVSKLPHLIECCPTSNLRLSHMHKLSDHPLPRFIKAGLNVCIGSDDPGIFATTLAKEVEKGGEILRYAQDDGLRSG